MNNSFISKNSKTTDKVCEIFENIQILNNEQKSNNINIVSPVKNHDSNYCSFNQNVDISREPLCSYNSFVYDNLVNNSVNYCDNYNNNKLIFNNSFNSGLNNSKFKNIQRTSQYYTDNVYNYNNTIKIKTSPSKLKSKDLLNIENYLIVKNNLLVFKHFIAFIFFNILIGIYDIGFFVLLTIYSNSYSLSTFEVTLTTYFYYFGTFIAFIFFEYFNNNYNKKNLISFFLFIIGCFTYIQSMFYCSYRLFSILTILVSRLIFGFAIQVISAYSCSIFVEFLPINRRGTLLSLSIIGLPIGLIIIVFICILYCFDLKIDGLNTVLYLIGSFSILIGLYYYIFIESSPRDLIINDNIKQAKKVIEKMNNLNNKLRSNKNLIKFKNSNIIQDSVMRKIVYYVHLTNRIDNQYNQPIDNLIFLSKQKNFIFEIKEDIKLISNIEEEEINKYKLIDDKENCQTNNNYFIKIEDNCDLNNNNNNNNNFLNKLIRQLYTTLKEYKVLFYERLKYTTIYICILKTCTSFYLYGWPIALSILNTNNIKNNNKDNFNAGNYPVIYSYLILALNSLPIPIICLISDISFIGRLGFLRLNSLFCLIISLLFEFTKDNTEIFSILLGIGLMLNGSTSAVIINYATEIYPTKHRPIAIVFVNLVTSVAGTIGVFIYIQLSQYSINSVIIFSIIVTILGFISSLKLKEETYGRLLDT